MKFLARPLAILPLTILIVSAPAHAAGGTPIPEPSNLALFGLGLAGLVFGRMMAKRKNDTRDD